MSGIPTPSSGWVYSLILLVAAPVAGVVAHAIVAAAALRVARLTESRFDESLVTHARRPARWLFPLAALLFVLPEANLPPGALDLARHGVDVALIGVTGWLAVSVLSVMDDLMASRYDMAVSDNLTARRMRTQIGVLRRIAIVIITVLTTGVILMTFPTIRHIGDSLLASAGIAGLVVGLAARPTLANLIAGVQLALTEPIRIDDVVIVEGEWGWIEEIRTTYVVVRIWDLRRLVVPLSYFIEKPFQNWTRTTANIIGSVFVYTDYRVPVQAVRDEVTRLLKQTELWDGKVANVQVTDATDRAVEIRALMSAVDSPKAWDLRCLIREQLLQFLQQRYPDSLPRARAELSRLRPAPDAAPMSRAS